MYLPKIIMNQPWNPYLLCGRTPICVCVCVCERERERERERLKKRNRES